MARTFGMEALFRAVGIYSHIGQRYEPVDRETLLYYKEAKDGQILEEGITEAGSMSSFIAAGCGEVATPSRDHIPLLKQRLFELQVAVAAKDRAAIDSLLSVDILSNEQGSDSLLAFVYGANDDYLFAQFGKYEIS